MISEQKQNCVFWFWKAEKVGGSMDNEVMSQLVELSIKEKGSFWDHMMMFVWEVVWTMKSFLS